MKRIAADRPVAGGGGVEGIVVKGTFDKGTRPRHSMR
jgi:hypothetical protein